MISKSENEIKLGWNKLGKIKVSVCCITFNHENFIESALDSFLMQETNFPFEVIVHDDASEDRTTEIIKEYQKKYPSIIKPVIQNTNQFKTGAAIYDLVFPHCVGDYLAFCEGDDFWQDPYKLQIQADFLDKNPDYFISCHNALIINEYGKIISKSQMQKKHMRDYNSHQLQCGTAQLLTLTWMRRNIKIPHIPERYKVGICGDSFLISALGYYGKSHYHDDIKPAVYRVHHGGVWSMKDRSYQSLAALNLEYCLQSYLRRMGFNEAANERKIIAERWAVRFPNTLTLIRELFIRLTFARSLKRRFKR